MRLRSLGILTAFLGYWCLPAQAQNTVVPIENTPPLHLPSPIPPLSFTQSSQILELIRPFSERPQIEVRLPKTWPAEKIKFVLNGVAIGAPQVTQNQDTWGVEVPVGQPSKLEAQYGEQRAELSFDSRQFAPSPLSLSVPPNTVVANRFKFLAVTSVQALSNIQSPLVAPATLEIQIDGKSVYKNMWNPSSLQVLPALPVALGKHQLQVKAHNVWGSAQSVSTTVFNLGVEMPTSTYVLVDKYNFNLYFVKDSMMQRIYPIATGTPRTPTPTGYFIIGKKEIMPNPHTSWGVLRLLIYRQEAYAQRHWSGYAIHGTNNPASIGREASHGCMRLFNENVTVLSHEIPMGTLLLIKNKLDTYIQEL